MTQQDEVSVMVAPNKMDNLANAIDAFDKGDWDSTVYQRIWAIVSAAREVVEDVG